MKKTEYFCDICGSQIKGNLSFQYEVNGVVAKIHQVSLNNTLLASTTINDPMNSFVDNDVCEACEKKIILKWAEFLKEKKNA